MNIQFIQRLRSKTGKINPPGATRVGLDARAKNGGNADSI